jgi:hypothetical protein
LFICSNQKQKRDLQSKHKFDSSKSKFSQQNEKRSQLEEALKASGTPAETLNLISGNVQYLYH